MDTALFSAINGAHAPGLDRVMLAVTALGYFPGLWLVGGAALLAVPRLRAAAFRLCLAVSLTYAVTSGVMKPLVGRARPSAGGVTTARTVEAQPPLSASFPSGHAATAAAGALAATRVAPALGVLWWTVATAIAYSRIYVGVHYPSDVVAGALLGALCAFLVIGGRHPSAWAWRPAVWRQRAGVGLRP